MEIIYISIGGYNPMKINAKYSPIGLHNFAGISRASPSDYLVLSLFLWEIIIIIFYFA